MVLDRPGHRRRLQQLLAALEPYSCSCKHIRRSAWAHVPQRVEHLPRRRRAHRQAVGHRAISWAIAGGRRLVLLVLLRLLLIFGLLKRLPLLQLSCTRLLVTSPELRELAPVVRQLPLRPLPTRPLVLDLDARLLCLRTDSFVSPGELKLCIPQLLLEGVHLSVVLLDRDGPLRVHRRPLLLA